MDNNELDKILKEKLNGKITPSKEFEDRIAKMVEAEKQKVLYQNELKGKQKFEKVETTVVKHRNYQHFAKILSMAAVIIVVFTLGMNLKTAPIVNDEAKANLISIKAIEPTKLNSGIIANNSEFTIYVEGDNVNKEAVQKSVYVEPALDYTIEKTLNRNEYKLKFKQNIPDNTIVKLQYVKNQITENSWAYQTSTDLSVTKTYPENDAISVSKKSVVDIELSYATVENFEKFVSITPNVKGNWQHLGRIWRFTPSNGFEKGKNYNIYISRQLSTQGKKLKDDYSFSFRVDEGEENTVTYENISADRITTSKPDEAVRIPYHIIENVEFGNVEISKFKNIDDFIEYVKKGNSEKAVKQGDYNVISQGKDEYHKELQLKRSLTKGFYVAKIKTKKGKVLFDCPIQISDISAYAMESERDVLVWVAKDKNLAKDVNIEYQGKSVKTDDQGIAKFEGVADGSENLKFATIENELVIGIYNYSLKDNVPAYIYTDRPLYKSTDTINIWGLVPMSLFYQEPKDDFYIELEREGKQKVEVGKDGNFTFKIDLKNHIDSGYTMLNLYYQDKVIAERGISIENYELQNYTYEPIIKKNYCTAKEGFEFDVKVKHITGLLVPNKKVSVRFENQTYRGITGQDGIAHFSLDTKGYDSGESDGSPLSYTVEIFNGDEVEYNIAETSFEIYVLTRDVNAKYEDEYKIKLYKINPNRNVKVDYELKDLYDGVYETNVDINIVETENTRVKVGEEYNEYTKTNEPFYDYETAEHTTKLKTIKSKDGVIEINPDEIKTKKSTEEKDYTYTIELLYKDRAGRKIIDKMHLETERYEESSFGYCEYYDEEGSDDRTYEIPTYSEKYDAYRYFWDTKSEKSRIGDKITFKLKEATQLGKKAIENNGKILNIFFRENITSTDILTENNFTYEFSKEDFPGIKMTSAYFLNGRFYRMAPKFLDFDEESKKVDIQINPDKEQYKPGDEVTLNITTTKDGKGVCSFVNVSVVNEALFQVWEDSTDLLEEVYKDKGYAVYTYSSYFDDILSTGGAGGNGGGDGPRIQFADTAHFETVYTDKNGNATVKFKLPENVTTYRVTAHSANEDLDLGVNTKQITSSLDFFVQSVEPRGIKTTDDIVLNATAIADKKYNVDYEFTIKELNKTLKAKAKTNNIATVNFGKLPLGKYHATIKGKHGNQQDAIEYEFKVVSSTQEVAKKTVLNINKQAKIKPSKNPIMLEIYSKNMEKYVKYIDFIESTLTERLDTQIAYNKIQEVKDKYYEEKGSSINDINIHEYDGEYLRNLKNGKSDLVLTALTSYYAKDYARSVVIEELDKDTNIFEYYLLLAAKKEPVLKDLIYLKQEKNITNYNKLLVTLALEFSGDYKNAKDLYSTISLSKEEEKQYKSLCAIIETFIDKKQATNKIDEIIKDMPADEYVRFAILSFFQNNSNEIGKEETIKVRINNKEKTITLNKMQIKNLSINNRQLADIDFETDSDDLIVSYYYQTMLEDMADKNMKKDINIKLTGKKEVGKTAYLEIQFNGNYEGKVRIALPNSIRLAQNYYEYEENAKYYLQNNNIDYITLYKTKNCKSIKLPVLIINSGNYKFENIVCQANGTYHISNTIDFDVK